MSLYPTFVNCVHDIIGKTWSQCEKCFRSLRPSSGVIEGTFDYPACKIEANAINFLLNVRKVFEKKLSNIIFSWKCSYGHVEFSLDIFPKNFH